MLSGKMTARTEFHADDHRSFNAHGEACDVGETFSGVEYQSGLQAVEQPRPLVPPGASLAQFALRWILIFETVTFAIPGAKNAVQAWENARSSALPALGGDVMGKVRAIYDNRIRAHVHQRW